MANPVKAAPTAIEWAQARGEARKDAVALEQKQAAKPAKVETPRAVPSIGELDARAFLQRQQIGAALYDRSFSFGEGARALRQQDAIARYATQAQASGGLDEKELAILDRKLARAEAQIVQLSTNARGADLDDLAAIDGKALDLVQENLMNRIQAGIQDGSLTGEEAAGLLAKQQEFNLAEAKLRESDGKLTAGEQKQLLDGLRKEADQLNRLRNNNLGVNLTEKRYSDQIDARQGALERQLAAGLKSGSLSAAEAETLRAAFDQAAQFEAELRADGRVDWRDSVRMSTALNEVEIALYELQRNKDGVQLKDVYVDVKSVDLRQAQQLESLARGISNRALTDGEGIELLEAQQRIQSFAERVLQASPGLDRGEYLQLQSAMNDFALRNQELQDNRDRWTGLVAPPAATPAPAAPSSPAPPSSSAPPVAQNRSEPAPASPPQPQPGVSAIPSTSASPVPTAPTPPLPILPPAGQTEPVKPLEVAEPEIPAYRPEPVRDIFGKLMTGALGSFSDRMRAISEDMAADAERRQDNEREPEAARRPVDPKVEERVQNYDRVAKSADAGAALLRKMA